MCGIAGGFAYSAPQLDRDELRRMSAKLATRGPDGSGEWWSDDGRIGLAHRRLAIIDLSDAGRQPMRDGGDNVVITFNGEIYNHKTLRAELELEGHTFSSHSDTEVLIELYKNCGVEMFSRLRGMFAFGLWDKTRRQMLLARDAFGIKPLYYSDDGRSIRFSSQVKSLLSANVDTSPEPAGHAGFYLWGSVPEPWTLFKGIRSLPAGSFMVIDENGAGPPRAFYSISRQFEAAERSQATPSRPQALEAIAAALRDSARAHLEADVPVGVFLSAGLDSTLIAALVSKAGQATKTVTLGFDEYRGTEQDETILAEQVARRLKTEHTTVFSTGSTFHEDRQALMNAMDQPSIDGVNTWFVAKATRSIGLKVALSGIGGDEVFGSYPSFRQTPRIRAAAMLPGLVPGLGRAFRAISAPILRARTSPKYAGLFEYGATMGGAYLLRRGLFMPWELPSVMDADMAAEGWRQLRTLSLLNGECRGLKSSRSKVSALEMTQYMRNQLLRDADWAGMAHALEIRVPLVDVGLLEAVTPMLAAHPRLTKKEVVEASCELPAAVLARKKSGFSVPVRDWIAKDLPGGAERGLRSWARLVHREASGLHP
jgi:asparagine synthase (glutamine-hydrolysing)